MVQQFYNYKDTSIGGALAQGLQGLTEGGVQGFQLGMKARANQALEQYYQGNIEVQKGNQELAKVKADRDWMIQRQDGMKTILEAAPNVANALLDMAPEFYIGPGATADSPAMKVLKAQIKAGGDAAVSAIQTLGAMSRNEATEYAKVWNQNPQLAVTMLTAKMQQQKAAADESFRQQQLALESDKFLETTRHNVATEQNAAAGTAKLPAGYSWADAEHTRMVATPGGPGDPQTKPLTESQGKASDQMLRAQNSYDRAIKFSDEHPDYVANSGLDQTLREGIGGVAGGVVGGVAGGVAGGAAGGLLKGPGGAVAGATTGASGGAAAGTYVGSKLDPLFKRWFESDEGKAFEASWAPFINATLRRDTGAAVTNQEWAYAFQMYIPMPGDSPEVVATKKANAQDVIEGMRLSAGPGADRVSPSSSGGGMPTISSQAAYDQLPQGAQYRTADGRIGTKR